MSEQPDAQLWVGPKGAGVVEPQAGPAPEPPEPSVEELSTPTVASSGFPFEVRFRRFLGGDAYTKYCFACGAFLDARSEICPTCGIRQQPPLDSSIDAALGHSRLVAALLGILLGTFGVHKFYLGKVGQGVVYLVFYWTLIPSLLGVIEGIWYLTMPDGEWAVHDALGRLPGWRVTPADYDVEERRWHLTAHDGRSLGRGARHEALEGFGTTEDEAFEMLARLLEERVSRPGQPVPSGLR